MNNSIEEITEFCADTVELQVNFTVSQFYDGIGATGVNLGCFYGRINNAFVGDQVLSTKKNGVEKEWVEEA
jgi:hypothetical protein